MYRTCVMLLTAAALLAIGCDRAEPPPTRSPPAADVAPPPAPAPAPTPAATKAKARPHKARGRRGIPPHVRRKTGIDKRSPVSLDYDTVLAKVDAEAAVLQQRAAERNEWLDYERLA